MGEASLQGAVDVLAVSHSNDEHDENFVPNLVDHAVVLAWAHVNAEELLPGFELLDSVGTGIALQPEDFAVTCFLIWGSSLRTSRWAAGESSTRSGIPPSSAVLPPYQA